MAKAQQQAGGQTTTATTSQSLDFDKLLHGPIGSNGKIDPARLDALRRDIMGQMPKLVASIPFKHSMSADEQQQVVVRTIGLLIRQIETAVRDGGGKEKIVDCHVDSFVDVARDSIMFGIPVDGRLAYVISYGRVAKFMPSYIGMLAAAKNTGTIVDGYAIEVYDGEPFSFEETGGEQVLYHKQELGLRNNPQKIVGVWAKLILPDGRARYEIAARADLDAMRAKASEKSPAWREFYGQMVRKSVLKRLLKLYATDPLISDLLDRDNAVEIDGAKEFARLAQRPIGATRTEQLAGMLASPSVASPSVEVVTGVAVTDDGDVTTDTEVVTCGECGGTMMSDVADGQAVLVCTACGVMESVKGGEQ